MSAIFLFALTILFPGLIQPAFAQRPFWPPTPSANPQGTVSVELKTEKGTVRVILPDDIRPGDTISGTVTAEPNPAQPANVGASIEGEVIEVKTVEGEVVASKKLDPSLPQQPLTFTVPQGASSLQFSMGKHIKQATLTINANPTEPVNFAPPRLGQTGRPLEIPGNFDGHAGNTAVNIGGKQMPVIAESPRKAVVQIPPDTPTGQTNLTVTDANGIPQTSTCNMVSIQLKADKLNLMKGERTNLHISVTGLQGLKDDSGDIKLQVENMTPEVVKFQDQDWYSTRPVSLNGGNEITYTTQLVGVGLGNFVINASIMEWIGKAIREAMRVAANNKWRKQLNELADMKDSAANAIIGNSKAVRDLKENAAFLREKAGDDKYWDGKGGDDVNPKDLLEDEKKKLKHTKTSLSSSNGNAIGKIGAALDAIDKMLR